MVIDPQEKVSPNASSRLAERVGLKYLCVLALIPLLAFLFPFSLFYYGFLPSLQSSFWGDMLEFSYHTGGQNADVVIFGDSSAIFGDDPVLIGNALHLKVLNLPNSRGSLPVTKDGPLQRYLQTNKPPRLIVFEFSPWGLNAANHSNPSMFEGEELLLRHGTFRQILKFSYRNPVELLYFPFRFYATHLRRGKGLVHGPITLGHTLYLGQKSLSDDCVFTNEYLRRPETAYVRELIARYTTPQTRTMVYLAPIPGCVHAEEIATMHFSGLDVASPAVLPAAVFASDGNFAHILPEGVDSSTHLLTLAIQQALPVR